MQAEVYVASLGFIVNTNKHYSVSTTDVTVFRKKVEIRLQLNWKLLKELIVSDVTCDTIL